MDVLIQAIGIIGTVTNVLSFQQKSKNALVIFQLIGVTAFAIHYAMLGAWVGCLLNFIGIIRGLAFMFARKTRRTYMTIFWLLSVLVVGSYAATFLVFGVDPTAKNLILEGLPIIAMFITTYAFTMTSAGNIRKMTLFSSPLWMIYNILHLSIGGIICEIISFTSIILGIIRLDRKKSGKDSAESN